MRRQVLNLLDSEENLEVESEWEPPQPVDKEVSALTQPHICICVQRKGSSTNREQHESSGPVCVPVGGLPCSKTTAMRWVHWQTLSLFVNLVRPLEADATFAFFCYVFASEFMRKYLTTTETWMSLYMKPSFNFNRIPTAADWKPQCCEFASPYPTLYSSFRISIVLNNSSLSKVVISNGFITVNITTINVLCVCWRPHKVRSWWLMPSTATTRWESASASQSSDPMKIRPSTSMSFYSSDG